MHLCARFVAANVPEPSRMRTPTRSPIALAVALPFTVAIVVVAAAAAAATTTPSNHTDEVVRVAAQRRLDSTAPVDVFSRGEAGYFCIKIPYILTTMNGTLLAFGEARMQSCSDYTATDLVWKRSVDGGNSWTPLQVLYSNSSLATNQTAVIGNAAPVQDRRTGLILLPFCRNNHEVLYSQSSDDGKSWTPPVNVTSATRPDWGWIGLGPPAGLQLTNGRIIIPSYHSYKHDQDGTFTHDHIVYSDDGGKTFEIGYVFSDVADLDFSNECQVAELEPGRVLLMTRTLLLRHARAVSEDNGNTFGAFSLCEDLKQPLDGVEGSLVKHPATQLLFFSSLNEDNELGLRYNLTLFVSSDEGVSWRPLLQINKGAAAYSALTILPSGALAILYERAAQIDLVFLPDHISFLVLMSDEEIRSLVLE